MTEAPDTDPVRFESIEEVFGLMRQHGLRVTVASRLVLEVLFKAHAPVSVQSIAQQAPTSGFDSSSIYRNLERLESLGVIRHVHLGHGPSLYMLVGAGEKEFLVCERCNQVIAVDPEDLDPARGLIRERFGYRARFTHFPIFGICPECLEEGRCSNT